MTHKHASRGRHQKGRKPHWNVKAAPAKAAAPVFKKKGAPMPDSVKELVEKIRYHNKKYWIDHKPEITDPEYDKLIESLRVIEPFNPVLDEIVEDDAPAAKVKHEVPMLSLEKVFTADDIFKFGNSNGAFGGNKQDMGIVASYKIDGSSCSLLYEDGKLVRAATRGNGKEGDDVTANAKVIFGIPHTIESQVGKKRRFEVRGEIYMSNASFRENVDRIKALIVAGKATDADLPANPRNYCAGSMKHHDANITRERKLSFMAYGLIMDEMPKSLNSEHAVLLALGKLGFETPLYCLVDAARDGKDIQAIIDTIGASKKSLPYEMDGIVWALNRLSLHEELGCTGHHPKYRIAFKFGREQGETEVVAIKWETSRTGRVVPTIQLKPIDLGGATVTYCTGHNAKNIIDNKLNIGAKVLVEREVIPYLVERRGPEFGPKTPFNCQSCGCQLIWDETKTDLLCTNTSACPAQLFSYLSHYVSRKVCNMLGVGDEILGKLLELKMIKTPADLFRLTEAQFVNQLERGESAAKKLVASIQSAKEQPLNIFLYSLGIPDLGNTISENLAAHYGSLDRILVASEEELLAAKIDKVGDKLAPAIVNGLKGKKALIEDLLKVVTIKKVAKAEGPLVGMSFCLTGHVEVEFEGKKYDARPDIEVVIKSRGGSIKSVSSKLDYLVAGDGAGDKVNQAKKNNVKIISGDDLAKMLK